MGFRKKTIKYHILGSPWRITFHSPSHYVKVIKGDSKAEVDDDFRTLDLDLSHLSHELIAHELGHAYAKERSLTELQLAPDQLEDFFCEIIGKHCKTIVKQADHLLAWGRKIKWKKT